MIILITQILLKSIEKSSSQNRTLLNDKDLENAFLIDSLNAGLANLKGHRSVGGMRASIYNAIEVEAVQELISFMKEFGESTVKRLCTK